MMTCCRSWIRRRTCCSSPRSSAECLLKDSPLLSPDRIGTDGAITFPGATAISREEGTVRTKGALSPTTAKLMVFKLVMAAAKTWRRLKGENLLPKVVAGVTFKDGTEVIDIPADRAA